MVRRGTSPKRNVADPGSIPGASNCHTGKLRLDRRPKGNRITEARGVQR